MKSTFRLLSIPRTDALQARLLCVIVIVLNFAHQHMLHVTSVVFAQYRYLISGASTIAQTCPFHFLNLFYT